MNDTHHWGPRFQCETCNKLFRSVSVADQHMGDVGYWQPKICCETCTKKFHDQTGVNHYMDALGYWAPKIACEFCDQKFYTPAAANQHMKDKNHYRNHCRDYDRRCQNENNLKMASHFISMPSVERPLCSNHGKFANSIFSQRLTAAPTSRVLSVNPISLPLVASPAT